MIATYDRKTIEEHTHPLDLSLWCRIIPVAFETARRLRLPLREIQPDSHGTYKGRRMNCLGCCWAESGSIRIVLRFKHPATGEWMGPRPEADVWRTLAHELAHLEVGPHNTRFRALMVSVVHEMDEVRFRRRR